MKNVILTGFMASGKTTIGAELAKMLGFSFVDTDSMIEKQENRTINEIFAEDGEEYFRDVETKTAMKVAEMANCVVSTGGGMVIRSENIEHMRKNGIVFYLDTDFDVIIERLKNADATRPLARGVDADALKNRFDSRQTAYSNCDYRIHITQNDTPLMVAKKIIEIYRR